PPHPRRQGAGCVTHGGIRSVVKVVNADVRPGARRAVGDGAIRLVAQLDQAGRLDLDVVEVTFCLADAAQVNEVWFSRGIPRDGEVAAEVSVVINWHTWSLPCRLDRRRQLTIRCSRGGRGRPDR